jgi:hypothetical protein
MDTNGAFNAYDKDLNLDPAERAEAEVFHNSLTTYLLALGIIVSAFLQGSFARKTMLKPLRDIDKVVILAAKFAHLLRDPNGAQQVATIVENALRDRYPNAKFERSRHAIQMDLGEDTFSFDVVPAFEVDDDTGDVWIMDLGKNLDQSGWKRSNTRRLMQVVSDRNKVTEGAFVHQVRHIKHFVRTKLDGVLPGLHVEAIAYTCITSKMSYADAAQQVLRCGAELLKPGNGYTDPTGDDQLSRKVSAEDRAVAQAAFAAAAEAADRAQRHAASGDHSAAIAEWFSIFGEPFPSRDPAEVLRTSFGGLISSSGTPTRRGEGTPAQPTRSWRSS